jgi:dolichol-phosphate mannosyltransferase
LTSHSILLRATARQALSISDWSEPDWHYRGLPIDWTLNVGRWTLTFERSMSALARSVSIIVPTLNESENIAPLVSRLLAAGVPFQEILFVDDRSADGTQEAIRSMAVNYPVRLIEREHGKLGLASAIMTGARVAQGDVLLVMDADLSHPPERSKDLLTPLFEDRADLVIGSRYITGGSTPGWPLWRRALSRIASWLVYPLTGAHDSMSGFFAISRSKLLEVAPVTTGFKIVFETIVQGGRRLRVQEIPIVFQDRTRGRSKMSFHVALRFFLRWLIAIFRRAVGLASDRKR